MSTQDEAFTVSQNGQQTDVSCWCRCVECVNFNKRLDNPKCTKDTNDNTFINSENIYQIWHCDIFAPCS